MHYLNLLLHGPQQLLEALFANFALINLSPLVGPLSSDTAKHFYKKNPLCCTSLRDLLMDTLPMDRFKKRREKLAPGEI